MPADVASSPPSDAEVIAAVLAGERDRFRELVERYQGPLLRLAHSRLGRHDWAEDVVQEAFLWAFKSLASYDSRYQFRTWLWTILLNQCHRHYQRRARRAERAPTSPLSTSPPPSGMPPSGETSPPDSLLEKERSHLLATVLAELPPAQADALRLRFYGDLKFQEIADVQGCSLTSAKQRVRSGLLKLAERLGATAAASITGRED